MENLPQFMHGVQLTGHGDQKMLTYRTDLPIPIPTATQVLIKVGAAGINNTDINTRLGWYAKANATDDNTAWTGQAFQFPRIQGADVCGTIVVVGKKVSPDRIGERILVNPCLFTFDGKQLDRPWYFGSECDGGFASYTVVEAQNACAIKSNYSDLELASFPCSYSTAENMLTRAKVNANDTILITGASGGVGSAALQLAKARGAKVIAQTTAAKKSRPQNPRGR